MYVPHWFTRCTFDINAIFLRFYKISICQDEGRHKIFASNLNKCSGDTSATLHICTTHFFTAMLMRS